MLRRAFLAALALFLTGRFSIAQKAAPVDRTVPDVLNFEGMITQALSIAAKVEDGAEQMLRDLARQGYERLEVPDIKLANVAPQRFPNLLVGQGAWPILLLSVLQSAKTADGQIVVTRQAVRQALQKYCPLYPFC